MVGNSTIKSKYEYGIALQDAAAHLGNLDDVKLLLNQGADVNVLSLWTWHCSAKPQNATIGACFWQVTFVQ